MDEKEIKRALLDIYQRLFAEYGPQYWWPAKTPFEVIIGAILTQSAAWTNVEKAIDNLKKNDALSPRVIRQIPQDKLAKLIHSCGYYNTKAGKLKAFAEWLGEYYKDNLDRLFAQDTSDLRSQLLDIHGIGEETADSIILYASNKPIFVIDAYTRRIINRLGLSPSHNNYSAYQSLFIESLPIDIKLFNEYHALLVRHAKEICRAIPLCQQCCLNPKTKAAGEPSDRHFPCQNLTQKH
jgi:endonuclease-3 related protein